MSSNPPTPPSLPLEKVFSIQIGTELFRLSGASIASDAPSYFSRFFEKQWQHNNGDGSNIRTLYIDRDPTTFKDIARHLQGYHVQPKDGEAFVKLFADAQFYSLPRLISQLFESEIIIQIGDRTFKIPRDLFSGPGDSPNFFTLGFGAFFASPSEVFPGLNRNGLLRPPAIIPPSVPNRSGEIFAQLLHLLRGYPLQIRNETHRAELLRDCRYFHLRGLEQKLIPHHISVNPSTSRSEILIRLEDVRRSGIHLAPVESGTGTATRVQYARPYVDEKPHDLILEIGGDSTILPQPAELTGRPKFIGLTDARFSSFAQVVADKAKDGQPSAYGPRVLAAITSTTDLIVNGEPMSPAEAFPDPTISQTDAHIPAKRRRVEGTDPPEAWFVRNGHWDVRFTHATADEPPTVFLMAAKLDVYTDARHRHRARAFLGS